MSELEGRTILVVEDNKTIRRQLSAILSKNGAVVLQASDGHEAVEKAAEMPDLILMDIQMPGMDGYEATRTIKETEGLRHIPIIMLTGNKEDEDIEQGMKCGACSYLTKPAPGSVIIAAIKAELSS
jgi:CheY-like chemotaxis protein